MLAIVPKNNEPESPKNIFLFFEKLPIKTGTIEESIIVDRNNKSDVYLEKNSKLTNKIKITDEARPSSPSIKLNALIIETIIKTENN
tara:strand:+ start:89 stop:349 length:261 start_codon:yes stop_codon:yes gene_type:complete